MKHEDIDRFNGLDTLIVPGSEVGCCLSNLDIEILQSLLRELRERRAADRWRSVKDEPPPAGVDVLVRGPFNNFIVRSFKGRPTEADCSWFREWQPINAAVYAPLPSPPESEAK